MLELDRIVEKPSWKGLLYSMVAKGEINPWDVNISVVVDRFMERLNYLDKNGLYVGGNFVLATSILLKMKALLFDEEEEDEIVEPSAVEVVNPPVNPLPKYRPITVDEIVEAVEGVMEKIKKDVVRKRKHIESTLSLPSVSMENVDEKLEKVFLLLLNYKDEENIVNVSYLVKKEGRKMGVSIFLYSLFLEQEGRVVLWQVSPFEDIFAKILEGDIYES